MTRVCIHQPDFLPWLGFFQRLNSCDIFIVLDTVQFIRRGWQHRDKIKTAAGAAWLTVPVHKKGRYDQLIRDVEIQDGPEWQDNHLKTLQAAYGKSPYFDPLRAAITDIYARDHRLLMALNMDFISYVCAYLGIKVTIRKASDLGVEGKSTELLVGLTQAVDGDVYLTGQGSRDYLDESLFESAGIRVEWQNFSHPVYLQQHGDFIPNLSAIDALMNCGPETRNLIRQ